MGAIGSQGFSQLSRQIVPHPVLASIIAPAWTIAWPSRIFMHRCGLNRLIILRGGSCMGLKDDLEKRRNDAQSSVLHGQDKLAVWQKTTAVLFDRVRELLADSISDGYLKPHTSAVRLYDYSAQQGYEIERLTLKCSTG